MHNLARYYVGKMGAIVLEQGVGDGSGGVGGGGGWGQPHGDWSSPLSTLATVGLLAHLLLFCRGE